MRVCICYSFHESRLWHVPITVERATRSLTLYDMMRRSMYRYMLLHRYIIPRKAPIVASFPTVILKLPDFDPSRTSADKRSYIMSASRHAYPISGLRGRYASVKLQNLLITANRFFTSKRKNLILIPRLGTKTIFKILVHG